MCSLGPPLALWLGEDREIEAAFERSLARLRSLPADIWVTAHARQFGRYRKYVASLEAEDPVEAFVDPEGYHRHLDAAEEALRALRKGAQGR